MKVSIIVLIYNAKKYIKPLFDSVFNQTYKNLEVLAIINGSTDGSKDTIAENFSQVKIIDPKKNLWFCKGNNLGITQSTGDLIYLVNQDVVLEPDNMEKMVKVFEDQKVGAATGKVLRYDFINNKKLNIIDSTGIIMSKSGRGKDRGQLEVDLGQYDHRREVFGVSGAVAMYRKSALEKVKYCSDINSKQNFPPLSDLIPSLSPNPSPAPLDRASSPFAGEEKMEGDKCEYFDENFVAYWEDVDISWRLNNAGFKNVYVPEAVSFHGRTAGAAKGGYLHLLHFIKHHKDISPIVRQLNYKNHILMYIKNARVIHPLFILREIAMLGYVIIFETSTLKVVPELLRQIPKILRKRKAARKFMR